MSDDVYIIGVAMTRFGKHLDKGVKGLTGESLRLVLADCNLTMENLEAAWFSNSGWGMFEFQHSIRGQVALSANGLENIPIVNVENACASGSTALHGAWMSVKAGLYECVLAIGTEKMYFEDAKDNSEITINLDGTEGYATSFLDEAFGGLARKFGVERCLKRIKFISAEEPLLIEEIKNYMGQK